MSKLVVVSGASGVGKSQVIKRLVALGLEVGVSHTSRPRREEETDHVDYHFVSAEVFREMIAREELLEWKYRTGLYYGLSKQECERSAASKAPGFVVDLDTSGGLAVKKHFPEAILIFLTAGKAEIERRLRSREGSRMSEEEILFRLKMGQEELEVAKCHYDHIIENKDLEECVAQVMACIS